MVSAWDVYWVMQLDAIGVFLGFATVVGALTLLFALIFGMVNKDASQYCPELESSKREAARAGAYFRFAKRLAIPVFLIGASCAFIPSSRTAAAMILVPKLTSPEVMQPVGAEAKELYGLAKQALRKLAADEPQKSK